MTAMKQIRLWTIQSTTGSKPAAVALPSAKKTETEALLESLLVQSPELLLEGLTLIGRQIPTAGGPLDLLGIDSDGRLIVFELKRGTLTRDAVAQVLDYASDLAEVEGERFARLIEDCSGRDGIDRIEDFDDWYAENYPNGPSLLSEPPRMMLVGLGVDDRARRIVGYLSESGLNISLLTFHGFEKDGELMLARQIEAVQPAAPPRESSGAYSKQANLESLRKRAHELQVAGLLEEAQAFLDSAIPGYKWPGKTAYAFSLTEHTDSGNPSLRVYVSLALDPAMPETLKLIFLERAVGAIGEPLEAFRDKFGDDYSFDEKYKQVELRVTKANWGEMRTALRTLLDLMVDGWKRKTSQEPSDHGE